MEGLQTLFFILSLIIFLFLCLGTLELITLTLGCLLLPSRYFPYTNQKTLKHLAVVIPAHNESETIANCVASVRHSAAQPSTTRYSIIVIADNCTDDTATQARQAGAIVWERQQDELRGKGYALDFAFNRLLSAESDLEPIDAVLIVDADTAVDTDFLNTCAQAFANGADALQCRYTVKNPDESMRTRLMHLALLAFNVLRLRGREYWGFSVGINGNGFGMTADTLRAIPYTARSVVEDLEYHLTLVKHNKRVRFIDTVTVRGDMPTATATASSQRARWDGGRFRMIVEQVPHLFSEVVTGKLRLIEPLLELLLLPLVFHVSLLLLLLISPFQFYALLGLGVVALHVLAGWWVGSRQWRDLTALAAVPFYILWKLLLLPRLLRTARKNAAWVRTTRETKHD